MTGRNDGFGSNTIVSALARISDERLASLECVEREAA